MSPIIARRLGACLNNTTKLHHVLRMSTTATRQQQLASDRYNEHLDRLTLLQAEDQRKLKPVRAKIGDYDAVLSKGLDFLTTLPAALEPLTKSRDTAHTSVERAIAITEAQAQLRRLKDGTLPNLLKHVEDLELEPYPDPGSDDDEIDFLSRVGGMSDAERKDLLDTLDLERIAAVSHVTESVKKLKWRDDLTSIGGSDDGAAAPVERKENPFAKVAAKVAASTDSGKKKAEEKTKFGMNTEDQFASVVADAELRKEAIKIRKVVGKNFGVGQQSGEIRTWKPEATEKPKTVEPRVLSHRLDEDDKPKPTWKPQVADKPKTVEPRVFSQRSDEDDKPRPKAPVRDLSALQAQLEASFKKY